MVVEELVRGVESLGESMTLSHLTSEASFDEVLSILKHMQQIVMLFAIKSCLLQSGRLKNLHDLHKGELTVAIPWHTHFVTLK